jgi:hypothetical protein
LPHGTIVRCQDYSLNKTNNRNLSHYNEEGFCFRDFIDDKDE